MSQHIIKEIQHLKQAVALLKEENKDIGAGIFKASDSGPGDRDQGVDIDDLLEWVKGLEARMDTLEKLVRAIGGPGGGNPPSGGLDAAYGDVEAKGPRVWRKPR